MLSALELQWVIDSLRPALEGALIQRVYERDDHQRVLQCRRPGESVYVLINLHEQLGRVHRVLGKPAQPQEPTATTMMLRKWLQGMVIRRVCLLDGDRVLRVEGDIASPDHEPTKTPRLTGDLTEELDEARSTQTTAPRVRVALIVEWIGRATNLYLLDERDALLHAWRPDRIKGRGLSRGQRYAPPPAQAARDSGRPKAAPHRWLGQPHDPSALIDAAYAASQEAWDRQQLTLQLERRLREQRKRAIKRRDNLERDLERATQAQGFRRLGELLQSAYKTYTRGQAQIQVPDYYDPELSMVTVELDPARSLQENIEHYFKQYRRMNDAGEQIMARLIDAQEHVERLDQAQAMLDQARLLGLEALQALDARLTREGVLAPMTQAQQAQRRDAEVTLPYRTYRSSRGTPILVGKGSKGNDHLCTRVARGRDIWLHARDWAGAHVLIRLERQQTLHQADLWEAAMLAAHFSKGHRDTLIDVTYTEAKHVRKPRGYAPGRVTVAAGHTIAVSLDDQEKLERLLQRVTP